MKYYQHAIFRLSVCLPLFDLFVFFFKFIVWTIVWWMKNQLEIRQKIYLFHTHTQAHTLVFIYGNGNHKTLVQPKRDNRNNSLGFAFEWKKKKCMIYLYLLVFFFCWYSFVIFCWQYSSYSLRISKRSLTKLWSLVFNGLNSNFNPI